MDDDPELLRDLAPDRPDVVAEVERIFAEEHEDSEWFVDPGESAASREAKRRRVEEEGSWQKSVRANTTFSRDDIDPHDRTGVTVPESLD